MNDEEYKFIVEGLRTDMIIVYNARGRTALYCEYTHNCAGCKLYNPTNGDCVLNDDSTGGIIKEQNPEYFI